MFLTEVKGLMGKYQCSRKVAVLAWRLTRGVETSLLLRQCMCDKETNRHTLSQSEWYSIFKIFEAETAPELDKKGMLV